MFALGTRLPGEGLLVGLVEALNAELDGARSLIDLLNIVLHALADLLHLPSPCHRLGALVRLLQLPLLVPDASQKTLCSATHPFRSDPDSLPD